MQPSRIYTSEVIAHRGASGEYPENTAAAFCAAIEQGAHRIEFDVQVTRDGVPVIAHDPIDTDYYMLPSDTLTLEEAMEICTIPVNIEIKDRNCIQRVAQVLRPDTIVSSSDIEVLIELQQISQPICELVCDNNFKKNIPLAARNNFIGVNIPIESISQWLLSGIYLYHLRAKVYTVNHREKAEELFRLGISGIFTDYPTRILQ